MACLKFQVVMNEGNEWVNVSADYKLGNSIVPIEEFRFDTNNFLKEQINMNSTRIL